MYSPGIFTRTENGHCDRLADRTILETSDSPNAITVGIALPQSLQYETHSRNAHNGGAQSSQATADPLQQSSTSHLVPLSPSRSIN